MSATPQTETQQKEIGFLEIVQFLKSYGKRLVCFALFTTLIAIVCLIAAGLFFPKKQRFFSNVLIQLPRMENKITYPSGKVFSANDLLSPAVLRQVYSDNNLPGKIKFDDFCKLFSLGKFNVEKALLSARFQAKLTKKNISVTDLTALEEEYAEALRKLENNVVEISMASSSKFSRADAVNFLHSIPLVWYNIYSKQEAKVMPSVITNAQIQAIRQSPVADGWFVTLDKARNTCEKLSQNCDDLKKMLEGEKLFLPSGESLENLMESIENLKKHRIHPALLLCNSITEKQTPLTKIFLRSTLLSLTRDIESLEEKYEGVIAAINILHPNKVQQPVRKNISQNANTAPLTINFEGSFFSSLSSLIRQSESIKLREKYANDALKIKEKISELKAEKKYYQTLLDGMGSVSASASLNAPQFNQLTRVIFDDLTAICSKVNAMKELIIKNCLTSSRFFATTGEVIRKSDYLIPFSKITLFILFVLCVVNLINMARIFYGAYTNNELSR